MSGQSKLSKNNNSENLRNFNGILRYSIPYVLIIVSFLGWELIKRTPIFISPTISQQALRLHGLLSGSMLLIFAGILVIRICMMGRRSFKLYSFEKYLLFLLFIDFIALVVGLIRGNSPIFLIGDTYKFAVIPLAYFCTVQTLRAENVKRLFLFIILLETAVTLESFGVYAVRLSKGFYERAPEHSISLLAFVFFLVLLSSRRELSRWKNLICFILVVIIGITAILSQARTLWAQMLLCPFILLLVERKSIVAASILKFAVYALMLLIPLSLIFSDAYYNITESLNQRIRETSAIFKSNRQFAPVLSADRRVVEVKATMNMYSELPNPADFLVGFGNGAEFYAPSAALGMGSRPGYKHHIHNGYISIFFRMGILGLLAFLVFIFFTLRNINGAIRHGFISEKASIWTLSIQKSIFIYLILTLIEFLTIYSFIGDIKWGVLLGLYRVSIQKHENSD
jgi:O-antigen ligase